LIHDVVQRLFMEITDTVTSYAHYKNHLQGLHAWAIAGNGPALAAC
jgi:hypothetical protein